MRDNQFTTQYSQIIDLISNIDPVSYSKSRNFLDGNVTRLSPYLTHGVIGLNQVKTFLETNYSSEKIEKLLFELAWKEYFLRVWENKMDDIWTDLKHPASYSNTQISSNIVYANTGINTIDSAIEELYQTGYMHNHSRMWTASLVTNIAKSYWKIPSQWMYYHLLDGDIASNTLSWQWVSGTFSSKKYFANQENINKYSKANQYNTFLDVSYEELVTLKTPDVLVKTVNLDLICPLNIWIEEYQEQDSAMKLYQHNGVQSENLILFHPWSLDPTLASHISQSDRILILEPSHFVKFPMSQKRINFILDLASNIPNLQVFVGEIGDLDLSKYKTITTKQYPAIEHWNVIPNIHFIPIDYMYPEINSYYGSFMSYWKKCQKKYRFR
jgi:deoxyribodipyrimidine photo-lyase